MAKQESHSIDELVAVSKALGDEGRVRVLALLKEGELCLCQIIDILGLAPSTVSKHMSVLRQAGLIEQRKEGRWHFYRLAGTKPPAGTRNGRARASAPSPLVMQAIRWVMKNLDDEPTIRRDAKRLCCIQKMNPEALTKCYRTPVTTARKAVAR
jgi:ArsR family transcriptional regulator, arsenate/arsenite/antimonite-responsive transcriptional repressor